MSTRENDLTSVSSQGSSRAPAGCAKLSARSQRTLQGTRDGISAESRTTFIKRIQRRVYLPRRSCLC